MFFFYEINATFHLITSHSVGKCVFWPVSHQQSIAVHAASPRLLKMNKKQQKSRMHHFFPLSLSRPFSGLPLSDGCVRVSARTHARTCLFDVSQLINKAKDNNSHPHHSLSFFSPASTSVPGPLNNNAGRRNLLIRFVGTGGAPSSPKLARHGDCSLVYRRRDRDNWGSR